MFRTTHVMFKFSSFLNVLIMVGIISLSGWLTYQKATEQTLVNDAAIVVEIPKGASFKKVITILQNHQVAIQPFWFTLFAYVHHFADKVQAGEYELQPGLTTLALLKQLASGRVKQYSVTFPEGWSFKEMLQLLAETPNLQHLLNSHDDYESLLNQLAIDKTHPEGWFFPDTYFFTKNTTDITLLKRAHHKMLAVLDTEWQLREQNLAIHNSYQALILASIIEKETGLASERSKIAGVFMRRLQKKIPLQTDPTVIYGMGDAYQGDIRRKDLKSPTPYNTYMIPDLPPTPIAMPGLDAIHAALHPSAGEALYFVATGDGGHEFTVTLAEHNKAVSRYLNRNAHEQYTLQKNKVSVASYD